MRFSSAVDRESEEVKLNLVPMIDVVFNLLVFFVMTFNVDSPEGDFNVRMPLASETPAAQNMESVPTLITIKLNAGENGNIARIEVDDGLESQSLTGQDMYQELTNFVERVLAVGTDPTSAADTEVEFEIDYPLKYQYTVKAIGAVAGKVLPDGSVKTLIEKIKFRDSSSN